MNTVVRAKRLEILDLARGIGFLLVLLRHCLGFVSAGLLASVMPQDSTILDFFFLISGFCAGYAYEAKLNAGKMTVSRAVADRLSRIFPMVALGTFIGALPFLFHMNESSNVSYILTLISTVKGMLLIPTHAHSLDLANTFDLFPLDVPLWFLFFDCLVYFLFLLVLRFLPVSLLIAIAAVSAWGLWLGATAYNNTSFGAGWTDLSYAIPRCLFDFTFGYLLYKFYRPQQFRITGLLALSPILILLAAIFVPISAAWHYSGQLEAIVAFTIMPIVIFLCVHAEADPKVSVIARTAARVSLAVYALHFPVVRNLSGLRWRYHLHGASGLALLILEFLLPLLFAYLATIYIDEPTRAFMVSRRRDNSSKTLLRPADQPISSPTSAPSSHSSLSSIDQAKMPTSI